MAFSWVSWYELNDEDFQAELDARESALANNEE